MRQSSAESTEPLAHLPQFTSHRVVFGPAVHVLYGAAGEVASAQRFDSLLQAAVQRRLSSGLRIQEQEFGHGFDEDLLPQADVSGQLGPDDTCRTRGEQRVESRYSEA